MAFGGLGLVLAVTGIYGVVVYSVTRRVREVGIRMALGARRSAILRLFMGQVLQYALLGLVLGIAGAAAVLLAATVLASWLPSRRATRVDPAETLRSD